MLCRIQPSQQACLQHMEQYYEDLNAEHFRQQYIFQHTLFFKYIRANTQNSHSEVMKVLLSASEIFKLLFHFLSINTWEDALLWLSDNMAGNCSPPLWITVPTVTGDLLRRMRRSLTPVRLCWFQIGV